MHGSTIRAWKTVAGVWQQVGTDQTDATYSAAGQIGIEVPESNARIDDFGGGTVVTGGGTEDGFVRVGGAWVPTDRQARVSGAWV